MLHIVRDEFTNEDSTISGHHTLTANPRMVREPSQPKFKVEHIHKKSKANKNGNFNQGSQASFEEYQEPIIGNEPEKEPTDQANPIKKISKQIENNSPYSKNFKLKKDSSINTIEY